MNHQDRSVEVLHEFVRRPATVLHWIGPWRSFEFPLRKPKFFSGRVHTFEVVNTIVRDEHFEPEPRIVVVPEDPVDHVTAITGARSSDATPIDKRTAT